MNKQWTVYRGIGAAIVLGTMGLAAASLPETWRAERRVIDLHQHIEYKPERLQRAVGIMDRVGVGVGVNLSGGTTTRKGQEPSEFERNRALADRLFPGRFVHYMNLDYAGWDKADFSDLAVKQVEEGFRLGAAGLKEYKRLGLYLRDGAGKLIKIDDPKLDPVWKRCGELGMPVSIHVADPRAFWLPYDARNERWTELKDHRSWWFGDPNLYPPREELLQALNRVIAAHPGTTFVCVHFANNAEDLDWVEASLGKYPNMMADVAARVPEIGRHDPAKVRRLFEKFQDRILFATDFMVYDRLILGSGGSGPGPDDAEAVRFYEKHWRWFETNDRQFEHMTPIQGDWKIDAIGLTPPVLRKVYFDNARRLLVRSLPLPSVQAVRVTRDFRPDGKLTEREWARAPLARLEYQLRDGEARPELASTAQLLWSPRYLYVGFEGPYTTLTEFRPVRKQGEREGLWERDVVEVFLSPDPARPERYFEFEVAPTGEKLDLAIVPGEKSLGWDSGFTAAVRVDRGAGRWTAELRIPLEPLGLDAGAASRTLRLNLYRSDRAGRAFLAWSPTASGTAHRPDRFGHLELVP